MTAGAKPYTMKVVRTVFNGGHEETYGNATRLVPTQQVIETVGKAVPATFLFLSYMEPLFYVSRGKTGEAGTGNPD